MKTNAQLILEESASDPVFKAQWDESANHRKLAILLLDFRASNGLSQDDLARVMDVPVSVVERIEIGEGPVSN